MIEKFSVRSVAVGLSILLISVLVAACAGNQSAPAAPAAVTAPETTAAPTSPPTQEADAAPAQNAGADAATGNAKSFQIVQDGTEARFYIDEVLMGNDKTVIGVTSLVEGELTVDPADPSSAQMGTIRIDARDLTTDSSRRNGAISRFVLQSNQDQYQYITFEPIAIEGMPAVVNVGDTIDFNVTGNLTIRDVTKSETFNVSLTVNSESELVGLGQTTIQRADYGLTIPSVPSVANVAEEVPLEIAFTARAVQ